MIVRMLQLSFLSILLCFVTIQNRSVIDAKILTSGISALGSATYSPRKSFFISEEGGKVIGSEEVSSSLENVLQIRGGEALTKKKVSEPSFGSPTG